MHSQGCSVTQVFSKLEEIRISFVPDLSNLFPSLSTEGADLGSRIAPSQLVPRRQALTIAQGGQLTQVAWPVKVHDHFQNTQSSVEYD